MTDHQPHAAWMSGTGWWLAPPGPDDMPVGLLDRAAAAALAAEAAGVGSLWVSESTASGPAGVPYEAYSLLGALAVGTARIHLGVVAEGVERRAPSILAKIVTGIDVISHGRGILALDGDPSEPSDAERLSEALTVCRTVLEDDLPTYAGRIYRVDAAVNRPAPVQAGGVPVVVFVHGSGPGRDALLAEAARSADAVVVDGGPGGVRTALAVVSGVSERTGAPGTRCAVLGRAGPGDGPDAPDRLVDAGAVGALRHVPWPWDGAAG